MKVEYERTASGSFLLLKEAEYPYEAYELQMLLQNRLRNLLRLQVIPENGRSVYWYDITGMQAVETLLDLAPVGRRQIEIFVRSLSDLKKELENYLLEEASVCFQPDFMFYDYSHKKIRFCLIPGWQHVDNNSLRNFMEVILKHLDHTDSKAVRAAYALYDKTAGEVISINDVMECIRENGGWSETPAGNQLQRPEHAGNIVTPQGFKDSPMASEKERGYWEGEDRMDYGRLERGSGMFRSPAEQEMSARFGQSVRTGQDGEIWLSEGRRQKSRGREHASGGHRSKKDNRRAEKALRRNAGREEKQSNSRSRKNVQNKHPDSRRQRRRLVHGRSMDEPSAIPQLDELPGAFHLFGRSRDADSLFSERYGRHSVQKDPASDMIDYSQADYEGRCETRHKPMETVVVDPEQYRSEIRLIYRGDGDERDIRIDHFPFLVGKDPDTTDAVLHSNTVSRIHARFTQNENEIFLEDLNSINGTDVNGDRLPYHTPVPVQKNDRIIFGTEEFIFRCRQDRPEPAAQS